MLPNSQFPSCCFNFSSAIHHLILPLPSTLCRSFESQLYMTLERLVQLRGPPKSNRPFAPPADARAQKKTRSLQLITPVHTALDFGQALCLLFSHHHHHQLWPYLCSNILSNCVLYYHHFTTLPLAFHPKTFLSCRLGQQHSPTPSHLYSDGKPQSLQPPILSSPPPTADSTPAPHPAPS